jgi:anti-sigma B factor antagonist
MEHPFEIEIIPDDTSVTFRLVGELDLSTVGTLQECLSTIEAEVSTVVLDLSDLQFLDSTGIGCFATLHRQLDLDFRRLELRGAQDHIRHVLEISGIDQVIPCYAAECTG